MKDLEFTKIGGDIVTVKALTKTAGKWFAKNIPANVPKLFGGVVIDARNVGALLGIVKDEGLTVAFA